jgi:hypothetical protein
MLTGAVTNLGKSAMVTGGLWLFAQGLRSFDNRFMNGLRGFGMTPKMLSVLHHFSLYFGTQRNFTDETPYPI